MLPGPESRVLVKAFFNLGGAKWENGKRMGKSGVSRESYKIHAAVFD